MTHGSHFTILYLVPTRALALDMHRRIQPLYKQLGLKSGIRTGDGKTLQDAKPHLLILTPESLDVLMGSQNPENRYFLKHLYILIIDEVHTFLGTLRGSHLSYLHLRLKAQLKRDLQTLTLSATIESPENIGSFFHLNNTFYYRQPPAQKLEPYWVHLIDERRELVPFFNDLFSHFKCKKLLVFANSRKKCEQLFEILNYKGSFSNNVLLHYSNLSTKERRFIESSFRERKQSVCIATSTLEMGIDIGDIDGVILMGPPPSTVAFLQRIGRGNRRQKILKFWGVCYGAEAERQLLQFLALFELALENKMGVCSSVNHYSVLLQQVLSCLYAKKVVSCNSLNALFNAAELPSIMEEMVAKSWLQPMPKAVLFVGGRRYKIALERKQIWSNFPPKDVEYEVILEKEAIAALPLSVVKQLQIGDVFQLVGKELKLLRIEEKRASQEVFVEISYQPITKELFWCGCGAPISFEIAQAMKSICLGKHKPQGMLNRTQRLLEKLRRSFVEGKNDLYVHRLKCGAYRYETFLGTVGNFILYHQIKHQFASKIEGLLLRFDELGIESNEWVSFKTLRLPHSVPLFQEWIAAHLLLLRQAFPWNSWLYSLPEDLQKKEIASTFLELRVLEYFKKYRMESMPLPPPLIEDHPKKKLILLKGKPWSFEEERESWGKLPFPEVPNGVDCGLTASQLHSYVSQRACSRLAHFQRVGFAIKPHPRFETFKQKSDFKKQLFETLDNVRFETPTFRLKQAIDHVLVSQTPLFLAQAKLAIDYPFSMRGSPDLIYLKPEGSFVRLEVWDIKDQETVTYSQKWRLAFYAYLLEQNVKEAPAIISECAGLIHRSGGEQKRTPFALPHFLSWMPRLIALWEADSLKPPDQYTLNSSCASCRYFSYCYQETIFKSKAPAEDLAIACIAPESIDFPPDITDWQSIESFLKKHFTWPVEGRLTAMQVARCLGLIADSSSPLSLYHDEPCIYSDLHKQIWSWCTSHVQITRFLPPLPTGLIDTYLFTQRQEWEERYYATVAFQKNPLSVRVEQFRAIGPLSFLKITPEGKKICYFFSIDPKAPIAKFRIGDFLKLSLASSMEIQDGFPVILNSYVPEKGIVSVYSFSHKMTLIKNQVYALDECATDWNAHKIETVLHRLKDPKFRPEILRILAGHGKHSPIPSIEWIKQWYSLHAKKAGLNRMQEQALLIPFSKNIGLIEGPPGTGKTHLLVWTLIALVAHARFIHRPIKILVTALTHQAIDQILLKLAQTLDSMEKIPIWKYERFGKARIGVELLEDAKLILQNTSFVLGATGFGIYQLLEAEQFPRVFDWIIFDEASQILPAYAALSLVFGKGNALFYGDTRQLPPVTMTNNHAHSILEELISRFDSNHYLRLNETYRMNGLICQFVSRHWYNQELQSSLPDQRLELPHYPLFADSIDNYLDPLKPLVVVPVEHEGNLQSSKEEAIWIAQAVKRLALDYSFPINEIGIISPHRLQTNTILNALKEIFPLASRYPKIDTVERMQGQEFDLVFFSATVSDQDSIHSAFLKDRRRFNVSLSRARKKFFFVASPLFFESFPKTEEELISHYPFEDFFIQAKPNIPDHL